MRNLTLAAVLALMSAPVFAESHAAAEMAAPTGDAEAGGELFGRQCVACHVVVDDAGETLAGRNAAVGPNLYGVVGRVAGSYPEFDYGDALIALGERGDVWAEDSFVGYVQDPTDWLRETLEDRRARGKMAFQVRSEEDAHDIYAFLATFSAPAEEAASE